MNPRRIALILLVLTLVLMIPVYASAAQETTPAAEATVEATAEATEAAASDAALPETTPVAGVANEPSEDAFNGASLLVLLVGLGAIGAVGFGTLVRSGFTPPQE